MTVHIALLRAVNLPGHNKVAMRDLAALATELGMKHARTLLQSGNLVFLSERDTGAKLERALERALRERLGVGTAVIARTVEVWRAVIAGNPFPEAAERDPGHLAVFFLKDAPGPAAAGGLLRAIVGREVVHVAGRQAYVVYPDGMGRSKLTAALVERRLGTRGTARNWNTVLKLGALAESLARA